MCRSPSGVRGGRIPTGTATSPRSSHMPSGRWTRANPRRRRTVSELVLVMALAGFAALVAHRLAHRTADRATLRLTFPRGVTVEQVVDALRALTGLLPPWWRRLLGVPAVAIEVLATGAGIEHVLT